MAGRHKNQRGFTIVELMIALSIVSLILLMSAVIMINIGNLFYKGVTQTQTQDNVRAVIDEIASQLQLNSSVVTYSPPGGGNAGVLCIGSLRYSFVKDLQMGSGAGQSQHILWRDKPAVCGPLPLGNLNTPSPTSGISGTELLNANARLTEFTLNQTISPYTITIGEAYGDPTLTSGSSITTACKGQRGDQFCATSYLVTTVAQRIN